MRHLFLTVVLAAVTGCSPTTDVTRTSTEMVAGRQPYQVVERQPSGDSLRIKIRVESWGAAHTVAEDIAVRTRAPYDRVEVDVPGPGRRGESGSRSAVLKWSTTGGFSWSGVR